MHYACFFVAYPYYFPHFLPISEELQRRGLDVHYVLSNTQNTALMETIAKDNNLSYSLGESELKSIETRYTFFANPYPAAQELESISVFLEHGIGTKSMSFYSSVEYFDIYLVEGSHKYHRISELYPEHKHKLHTVGFSKLDPVINMSTAEISKTQNKFGIDSSKKTILYAPTFFPSSIERMSDDFPQEFSDCNILVKAHYLTYERAQYKKQRDKLALWSRQENCHVVGVDEYNLVPLYSVSDVMISDESSAMFEFASLDKPVVSNRYVKLRWSYYLMPWKLKRRIDSSKDKYRKILHNADDYSQTVSLTRQALENPHQLQEIRREFAEDICGTIDGNVSARIVDLLQHEAI